MIQGVRGIYGLFQHTAARRRLGSNAPETQPLPKVSTHSRPKAAGQTGQSWQDVVYVSTHSRPKAAGSASCLAQYKRQVSTHSRPKAAGARPPPSSQYRAVSTHSRPKAAGPVGCTALPRRLRFNTQPPEGGWDKSCKMETVKLRFQHTAARRRLAPIERCFRSGVSVSTHSRPKAAGCADL